MSRFLKLILIVLVVAVGYVYSASYFDELKIKKQEDIAQSKMTGEVAQILSSWAMADNSKLFINEIKVEDLKMLFGKINEDYGSCKLKKSVCVSNERTKKVKQDKYETPFGSSIECSYEVSCERKETKGLVIFKKTTNDSYQVERFVID